MKRTLGVGFKRKKEESAHQGCRFGWYPGKRTDPRSVEEIPSGIRTRANINNMISIGVPDIGVEKSRIK